jgi:hypothetical protein
MAFKAVKKLTKTPDQDWSGVYINKVEQSVSSTPDPRDQKIVYNSDEVETIRKNYSANIKSSPGFEGWDREYVGDNELKLIYYFSSKETANSFIHGSSRPNKVTRENFVSVLEQKNIKYSSQWILVDENGQEEVMITYNP